MEEETTQADSSDDATHHDGRFSQIAAKRQEQVDPRRTKIVRMLRLALPVLALILITVVFAWPKMDQIKPAPQDPKKPAQQKAGSNELINPHFQGLDNDGQPFTVTAGRAIQSAGDADIILLDEPRGTSNMKDGRIVHVRAEKGTYAQHAQHLVLEQKVVLSDDQGYHLDSERATVDLGTHKAWTDLPVQGDGPAASITATGMQADNASNVLIFTGPATLILKHAGKGL